MLNRMMLLVVAVGGAALSPFILQRPTERALEQPVHAPVMQVGRRHFPVVLPEREFVALRTDLFAARESAVQADPKPAESAPIAAASAPPMPYRFVGTLLQNNRLQWFLAKADVVFPVIQGEVIDDAYRVETIRPDAVTLVHLPSGVTSRIALAHDADGVQVPAAMAEIPVVRASPVLAVGAAKSQPAVPAERTETAQAASDSRLIDANGTARSGTRAAHLRRELMQQLPPSF